MALNIDSIRNYAGTGSITLNQQGTGVEKSSLQRFRSFFDIGDARMKNAATLTAIHHAILNDPRFAAQDIQSEAARLLSQVRTDRAIDAAQIKGIIQTLDSLVLNTEAAVKERVKGMRLKKAKGIVLDSVDELYRIALDVFRSSAGACTPKDAAYGTVKCFISCAPT